jgi:hypothetical protein
MEGGIIEIMEDDLEEMIGSLSTSENQPENKNTSE